MSTPQPIETGIGGPALGPGVTGLSDPRFGACPLCSQTTSIQAEACPGCGHPLGKRASGWSSTERALLYTLLCFFALATLGLLVDPRVADMFKSVWGLLFLSPLYLLFYALRGHFRSRP